MKVILLSFKIEIVLNSIFPSQDDSLERVGNGLN